MTSVTVKAFYATEDGGIETRRFAVDTSISYNGGIFALMQGKIGNIFPDLKGKRFDLFWKDADGDFVTMSTDEEMHDALANQENGNCKVYIKVTENYNPQEMPHSGEDQVLKQQEQEMNSSTSGSSSSSNSSSDEESFGCYPPPPPPPFGGPLMMGPFGGPWGFHGRRHQDLFKSCGVFSHHDGPFGYGGKHRHGGWHEHGGCGQHRYGKHHRHDGHGHRAHRHDWPHKHGGHHGHDGPFWHGGPKDFGGHWNSQGWGKQHHGGKDKNFGWKAGLRVRDSVPMSHRRWAKGFIQNWRQENLKNATTTTESSSDGSPERKISMAKAGVPLIYADWLQQKLERWHKKWSRDDMNDQNVDIGSDKEDKKAKKAMKAVVTKPFRKWTKWYLFRNFGPRQAPKFKTVHHGPKEDFKWKKGKCMRKTEEKEVPKEFRKWTKQYIRNWRFEKKIENAGFDVEAETSLKDIQVPEPYVRWLEIFLYRWHTRNEQLERDPKQPMEGNMCQFRDTVPMNFRSWVKRHMCKHYRQQDNGMESFQDEYKNMLLAFQKQWLKDQGQQNEKVIVGLQSNGNEVSDKKDQDGKLKQKVKFSGENQERPESSRDVEMMNTDSDQEYLMHNKGNMSPGFRQWAKQALSKWDRETLANDAQSDQSATDVTLPPDVYKWMYKFMMKDEKKKMKQEFKEAKQAAKAARKQKISFH